MALTIQQQADLKACVIDDIKKLVQEPDLKKYGITYYSAGLVYDVLTDASANVSVVSTLTAPTCSEADNIFDEISRVSLAAAENFLTGKKISVVADPDDEVVLLTPKSYDPGNVIRTKRIAKDVLASAQGLSIEDIPSNQGLVLARLTFEPLYDLKRMPETARAALGLAF